MEKKGLSEVVTAILIVLLAVAAVVIVWAVIRPMIQSSSSQVQTACVTLDLEVTEVDTVNNMITIKRNVGEGELNTVKVVLNSGTESETQTLTVAEGDLEELETKEYPLSVPGFTNGWDDVENVEIAGEVVTTTSDTQLCPVSDSLDSSLFVV